MVSCRWGSTASRLQILRGGSLIFTTKFQEIPATLVICILWPCKFPLHWWIFRELLLSSLGIVASYIILKTLSCILLMQLLRFLLWNINITRLFENWALCRINVVLILQPKKKHWILFSKEENKIWIWKLHLAVYLRTFFCSLDHITSSTVFTAIR